MSTKPKVIIIGAGPAGIAAATKLIENGFSDLIVLEAENRIGGRVHSVDFGGSVVDLGGTWVHGEKDNIVYEMVKDLNLLKTSHNNYQDNTFYLSDGTIVDKNLTNRLHKIGMDIMGDEAGAKSHPNDTFGTYFKRVFQTRVLKEFPNNRTALITAKYLENWLENFFCCLNSTTSWDNVSTTSPFWYKACDGDQQWNWQNFGYRTILYIMMKKKPDITRQLPVDDKIFVNKEVTKIVWDENNVNSGGVTVTCSDGSSYNSDHVIVTVPLGVLKRFHADLFEPELPAYKANTIQHVAFGTVNKILLKFPKKWWPDDLKGFSFLWTEEDRKSLLQDFPYGPSQNGKSWLEDIFGFYVLDSHPRVLLGWVVGEMAVAFESIPEDVVIKGSLFLLRKFAGKKYNVTEPDGLLCTKWGTNTHFCGSYVHVGMEFERNKCSVEDLARPVVARNSKQTVLFAGEATHPTHFSTVHGAIETGYREADRLINIYK